MASLNVIKVSRVTPTTDSMSPLILPLTFFDLMWLNLSALERVTFYRHTELSKDSFYSLILPKLEESLSLALTHFLPLAGHLKWDPQDPKPHIAIFPQGTLSLTVSETDADFSHLSGKGLRFQTELRPLVPELMVSSDSVSVLALQITLFPNQGFCIGIAVNHAAVDGKTVVNFLKSWAHICKYGAIPQDFQPPMLLDRNKVINVPSELELKILQLPQYNVRTLKIPPTNDIEDAVQITLDLSQENMKKLRERAKSESTTRSDLHLSTFVITYAYVLTCVVKARGGDADRPVPFTYVADFRDRLDPPVPASYLGNCVVAINLSEYKAKTFLREDGFINGVKILSDSIRGLSSRGVVDTIWELYEEGLKTMEPGVQKLYVGGPNKFGIYGSDFGWGTPVNTENVTPSRHLRFTMSERRDETGGVEIDMCLKKCEMDVFVSVFQSGLEN
ncbi:hypothetical protein N665_0172s0090 [Sinapis alba]|nr:hypothetical protein N665_0172s0090 [Sinapis alba]